MRALVICVLVACGGAQPPPKAPEHDDAPPLPVHKEAEADDRATLVKLEQGDCGCYVTVARAGGQPATLPGDFDLCPGGTTDATPFIGKVIRYATKHGKTEVAGYPDCNNVDLVITIVPAP